MAATGIFQARAFYDGIPKKCAVTKCDALIDKGYLSLLDR